MGIRYLLIVEHIRSFLDFIQVPGLRSRWCINNEPDFSLPQSGGIRVFALTHSCRNVVAQRYRGLSLSR